MIIIEKMCYSSHAVLLLNTFPMPRWGGCHDQLPSASCCHQHSAWSGQRHDAATVHATGSYDADHGKHVLGVWGFASLGPNVTTASATYTWKSLCLFFSIYPLPTFPHPVSQCAYYIIFLLYDFLFFCVAFHKLEALFLTYLSALNMSPNRSKGIMDRIDEENILGASSSQRERYVYK